MSWPHPHCPPPAPHPPFRLSPFPESKSSSWNAAAFPPGQLTCWVDPRTGIVLGLDDGNGLRCGLGEGVAVQIPLPRDDYVQKLEIGIVPKTDFIGQLKFSISTYNASKSVPARTLTCGNATKTWYASSGQGAVADSVAYNLRRYVDALGDDKNKTAANALKFQGAHLAATQIGNCLTDRYAAAVVNATGDSLKDELAAKAAFALGKPTLKINSSIDAKSLDPSFTPRTCKKEVRGNRGGVGSGGRGGARVGEERACDLGPLSSLPPPNLFRCCALLGLTSPFSTLGAKCRLRATGATGGRKKGRLICFF